MIPPIRLTTLAATAAAAVTGLAACGDAASTTATAQGAAATTTSPATAAATCTRSAALTEGPYWKAGSPTRRTIRTAGTSGMPLRLTGRVDTRCRPIAGATVDVWQADGLGRLRQRGLPPARAAEDARRRDLDPEHRRPRALPRPHRARPREAPHALGERAHHQLFLPGSNSNHEDGIYVPSMVVKAFRKTGSGYRATFTFALPR